MAIAALKSSDVGDATIRPISTGISPHCMQIVRKALTNEERTC
jgi:hypothetical protein